MMSIMMMTMNMILMMMVMMIVMITGESVNTEKSYKYKPKIC